MRSKNEGAVKEKGAMQKKKLKNNSTGSSQEEGVLTDLDLAPEHLFIMETEEAWEGGKDKRIGFKQDKMNKNMEK